MEPSFVAFDTAGAEGSAPREVRVLLDSPYLKLATVLLRRGTELPQHKSQVRVTITILSGAGTVRVGDETRRVVAGEVLVLPAGAPHSMTPDAGSDAVLLVHHLRVAAPAGAA